MNKFKYICLGLICAALQAAETRDWTAELRAGIFFPLSDRVQKVYAPWLKGWIEGEAEYTYEFAAHWRAWGNGGYSFQNGHTKHHRAHIQIIPVSAGIKYVFLSQAIRPYLGLGPCYTFLHLRNYSHFGQRIYKNRFGFVAKSGVYFDLPKHFLIDLFLDYYYLNVYFRRGNVHAGGLRAGLGLGYSF
jgi:hypothetical protein